jgi:hypothetical protein
VSVVDNDREEARSASYAPEVDHHAEPDAYSPGDGDLPPIPAWITEASEQANRGAEMPMSEWFDDPAVTRG